MVNSNNNIEKLLDLGAINKKRNAIYIISNDAFTLYDEITSYRIDKAVQNKNETLPIFLSRLISKFEIGSPIEYNLDYLIYLDNPKIIEDIVKERYKDEIVKKKWIKDEKIEHIINFIRNICKILDIEYEDYECKNYKIKIIDIECEI